MMHLDKKQKVKNNNATNYNKEEVLFNTDTLSKIISYLSSVDLLSLALTSKRFGVSNNSIGDSIIEESVRIIVQDIATEEQQAALPHYDGESSLADYHYLQLMRYPLTFDQLVGEAEYVNDFDKSCIRHSGEDGRWETAFSDNILRAGKHYASFEVHRSSYPTSICAHLGVMRPGKANRQTSGATTILPEFYQNFSRYIDSHGEYSNNSIHCCLYNAYDGECYTSDWESYNEFEMGDSMAWDGMEIMSSGDEMGLLLDLDEGTLTVYKNGRKLGVMKRGLAGPYCWVASMISVLILVSVEYTYVYSTCQQGYLRTDTTRHIFTHRSIFKILLSNGLLSH